MASTSHGQVSKALHPLSWHAVPAWIGQVRRRCLIDWQCVHHLIRVHEAAGESGAAELAARLGAGAETARELAYRLYTLCERKKRPGEALAYNALVQSWPEIMRLAQGAGRAVPGQAPLFGEE